MKNFTKIFAVAIIAILCFTACRIGRDEFNVPYATYHINGKVIDKETKEPIEEVMVVLYLNLPTPKQSILKTSPPPPKQGWSRANGEFEAYEYFTLSSMRERNDSVPVAFLNGRYNITASHKDTIIWVDFKNAKFTGDSYRNWKGSYELNMGEVELEKLY